MRVGTPLGRHHVWPLLALIGTLASPAFSRAAETSTAPARATPPPRLPLEARDDAFTLAPATTQVGVFAPLRQGLSPRMELSLHPVLFLIAPNALLRVRVWQCRDTAVLVSAGISMPSFAMRLLQGFLFPSWDRGGGQIGWTVVPNLGAAISHRRVRGTLTAKADVAFGIDIVRSDVEPLQAPAPLELLFAPVAARYRARVGLLWDGLIHPRVRYRLSADTYFHGIDDDFDPGHAAGFTFRGGAGVDLGVGRTGRLALGVAVWNSFQYRKNAQGDFVRSTDVLPVLDYLWTF